MVTSVNNRRVTPNMPTLTVTNEFLAAALIGFEAKKREIDARIAELRAILAGAQAPALESTGVKTKRRKFSAAARKRMAAAQKARWAKVRGESRHAISEVPRPKRKMSAAGRKRISEATTRRWAAKRAEDKKALNAPKRAA
jgi:hypothetical protein